MLIIGHILIELEAAGIVAGTDGLHIQGKDRAVFLILCLAYGALTGSIGGHNHIVKDGIDHNQVAFRCCQAVIQGLQLFLRNVLLSSCGQRIVALLCSPNAGELIQVTGHLQLRCIRQSIHQGSCFCGCFLIHQRLALGEHTGNEPLTGYVCTLGEQTEQISVNNRILRQFNFVPAGIQDPVTHIVPGGVSIQIHRLCACLGVIDIEEQVSVGRNVLVNLPAGSIVAGADLGNGQGIYGAVGIIPGIAHRAVADTVGGTHSHLVAVGIHRSLVAFNGIHTRRELTSQAGGHHCLAFGRQLLVSIVSFPDIGNILQAFRHLNLAGIRQARDKSGNLGGSLPVDNVIGNAVQAGHLPGAYHIGVFREQTEGVVVDRHISGKFNLVPAGLQGPHFQILPAAVCIQLHCLRSRLGIVDIEEQILLAFHFLDETETGGIGTVCLFCKGQIPNGAVVIICGGGCRADGLAVRCTELDILLGGIKNRIIAGCLFGTG